MYSVSRESLPVIRDCTTKMTLNEIVTRTPAYMAPEIALGGDSPDGRTDLYILACVTY